MQNSDLRKQYDNGITEDFSLNQKEKNQVNREIMYEFAGVGLFGKKVLDLCCGDGIDANYYKEIGASVCGIDASEGLIAIAKKQYQGIDFQVGFAEDLSYEDSSFDMILSKYAIMTSPDMTPIFGEINRVLKPGGTVIYLVTHPLRQWMERRDFSQDYFEQAIVTANILDNTVSLREPTHTMNEFFNADFFAKFMMVDFKEVWDPAAEQIGGGKYPGFFIVKAIKK